MNKTLSICIPTYNRAKSLKACIINLIPQLIKYQIPIYISDNASPDCTESVVKELQQEYELIFYSRQDTNVGPDRNFASVLRKSETDYAWLLSDDDLVLEDGIQTVLQVLSAGACDMLVVNAIQGHPSDPSAPIRVRSKLEHAYTDRNRALIDLGWHTTWISCLIFSRKMAKEGDFEKYFETNFVHFGTIFDFLSIKDVIVRWVQTPIVCCAVDAIAGYSEERMCELFAMHWSKVVLSLPEVYSREAKRACIKNHAMNVRVLTARWFLSARVRGHMDLQVYRQYAKYFKMAATASLPLILALCVTPRSVCKVVETLYSFLYSKLCGSAS